jgi:hypothetical protein
VTSAWKTAGERALLAADAPHVITTQDLLGYAAVNSGERPASASFTRWLQTLVSVGKLQPVTRGVYLNRYSGPTVHAAEAAQYLRRGAVVSLAWVLERSGALNNFGDTVTCLVPLAKGWAPPKVGDQLTAAGPFRFYAMPQHILLAGSRRIDDVQDLKYGYPRATPERALMDWVYLGSSARSRLPLPPLDIDLHEMSLGRLRRLAKAMGTEDAWAAWHARWKANDKADYVA